MNEAAINIALKFLDKATAPFGSAVSNMEKNASRMNSALDRMTGLAKTAAAAFGAWQIAKFAKDVAWAAAQFDTMGVVMGTVGRNAGYTADEMDKYARGVQAAGISMNTSRLVTVRMTQAQIDLNKSTQLARIAQDAAVIGMTNSSQALEDMIYGIQSANVRVLRTIGINVSWEASYKKMAQQLGVTTDDLSEYQKTQARVNEVIEYGSRIAGTYEAAMGTAGKQITSFTRYIQDFQVLMGQAFGPALVEIVQKATETIKQWQKDIASTTAQESLKKLLNIGKDAAIALIQITDAVARIFGSVLRGWSSMPDVIVEFGIIGALLFGIKGKLAFIAIGIALDYYQQLANLSQKLLDNINEFFSKADKANNLEQYKTRLSTLRTELKVLEDRQEELSLSEYDPNVYNAIQQNIIWHQKEIQVLDVKIKKLQDIKNFGSELPEPDSGAWTNWGEEIGGPIVDVSEKVKKLGEQYGDLVTALTHEYRLVGLEGFAKESEQARQKLEDLDKKFKAYFDKYPEARTKVAGLIYAILEKNKAHDDEKKRLEAATKAERAYLKALEDDDKALRDQIDSYDDLNKSYESWVKQIEAKINLASFDEAGKKAAEIEAKIAALQDRYTGLSAEQLDNIRRLLTELNRVNEVVDAQKEAARRAEEAWRDYAQNVQSTLHDVFRDLLDGTQNIAETIVNIFKDMVANIAAELVTKKLVLPITAKIVSGLGGDSQTGLSGGGGIFSSFGNFLNKPLWLKQLPEGQAGPPAPGASIGDLLGGAGMGFGISSLINSFGLFGGSQASNIGSNIGGAIGGAVGFAIGGPLGSALLGAAGSLQGGFIGSLFGSKPEAGNIETEILGGPASIETLATKRHFKQTGEEGWTRDMVDQFENTILDTLTLMENYMTVSVDDLFEQLAGFSDKIFDVKTIGEAVNKFMVDFLAAAEEQIPGFFKEGKFKSFYESGASFEDLSLFVQTVMTASAGIKGYLKADIGKASDTALLYARDPFAPFRDGLSSLDKQLVFIGNELNNLEGLDYANALQSINELLQQRYELELSYLIQLKTLQKSLLDSLTTQLEGFRLDTMTPEEQYQYWAQQAGSAWNTAMTTMDPTAFAAAVGIIQNAAGQLWQLGGATETGAQWQKETLPQWEANYGILTGRADTVFGMTIDALFGQNSQTKSTIDDLTGNFDGLNGKVVTVTESFDDLIGAISGLKIQIEDAGGAVEDMTDSVDTLGHQTRQTGNDIAQTGYAIRQHGGY